jgi:hypothetical protein
VQFLSTFISLLLFLANAFFELTPSFQRFLGNFWLKIAVMKKLAKTHMPNIPGKFRKIAVMKFALMKFPVFTYKSKLL